MPNMLQMLLLDDIVDSVIKEAERSAEVSGLTVRPGGGEAGRGSVCSQCASSPRLTLPMGLNCNHEQAGLAVLPKQLRSGDAALCWLAPSLLRPCVVLRMCILQVGMVGGGVACYALLGWYTDLAMPGGWGRGGGWGARGAGCGRDMQGAGRGVEAGQRADFGGGARQRLDGGVRSGRRGWERLMVHMQGGGGDSRLDGSL